MQQCPLCGVGVGDVQEENCAELGSTEMPLKV